jgi:hypothetical protein
MSRHMLLARHFCAVRTEPIKALVIVKEGIKRSDGLAEEI